MLNSVDGCSSAKMDATENDVPSNYEVQGFPTLYFAPKNNKQNPQKYEVNFPGRSHSPFAIASSVLSRVVVKSMTSSNIWPRKQQNRSTATTVMDRRRRVARSPTMNSKCSPTDDFTPRRILCCSFYSCYVIRQLIYCLFVCFSFHLLFILAECVRSFYFFQPFNKTIPTVITCFSPLSLSLFCQIKHDHL